MFKLNRRSYYVIALLLGLTETVSPASEFYVSPNGVPTATGGLNDPLDLATAFNSDQIQPGDVVWLRGGIYRGSFYSGLQGAPGKPIVVRQYPGERATIVGSLAQSLGGWVAYWGFEVTQQAPLRSSQQSDPWPTDLPTLDGINLRAPSIKLINLVVHDIVGNGLALWEDSPDLQMSGCLVYQNGWDAPDRGHGHGIYGQNRTGWKTIRNNISFANYGDGLHLYGTDSASLNHFLVEKNVLFNNGQPSTEGLKANNLRIGGGSAAAHILVRDNVTFNTFKSSGTIELGSDAFNEDIVVQGNYFNDFVRLDNWDQVVFIGNTLVAPGTLLVLWRDPLISLPFPYLWDNNHYFSQEIFYQPFSLQAQTTAGLYYDGWVATTGFDWNSDYYTGRPSGMEIRIIPNEYEPGAASIVICNWGRNPTASVDLSSIVPLWSKFEIRNAQDYFGGPVVEGTYPGGSVILPMQLPDSPGPFGTTNMNPHTSPDFNVFMIKALPTVGSDFIDIQTNQPVVIPTFQLLLNDSHFLTNTIYVGAAGPLSAKGGRLILTNDTIVYTPAPGGTLPDCFHYSVRDSKGNGGAGTVYLDIQENPTNIKISPLPNGETLLRLPLTESNTIQASTNLLNWTTIGTGIKVGNSLRFVDGGQFMRRFYRLGPTNVAPAF